ncbi:hypothetical protein AGABI2DRAFT_204083 [Agaricus bisporus var. bisporus H97]|uniref:hypothetical protein n=1 Tax=Agaricus bisporus var. bisporus (strain H97 / ATCC MYA-4626 / FGSC 10389) TaxID=936046 RepID=UPI00029F706E|nr:hypothetical protein AGABI2DRAFT_204083 [Agaricus bisporus var. bisporus H97]EKV47176.1 hypothetical protein AGABI2DRAFT_204083 [Agaricus bisporus var. bisporus H97]
MRLPTALLTVFLTLALANASNPRDHSLGARHSRIASRMSPLEKKAPQKRCVRRDKGSKAKVTSTAKKEHTSVKASPSEATFSPPSKDDGKPSGNASSGGKILVASGKCGGSNAVAKTTKDNGPNGSIGFLNCGVDGSGWNPPPVHIDDVIVKSLSEAVQSPSSPFHACKSYVPLFNQYGDKYGIPAIFLASFAMQESSCNPNTVGGGGEQGLMQITKDKCDGAPGGDCKDPDFNIRTGAKFFADTLKSAGGNVLKAVAFYNGWYEGLTIDKATAARHSSCCRCQQNLDYLHQFFNGWCQNIDAYDRKLGKYFNLDTCPT